MLPPPLNVALLLLLLLMVSVPVVEFAEVTTHPVLLEKPALCIASAGLLTDQFAAFLMLLLKTGSAKVTVNASPYTPSPLLSAVTRLEDEATAGAPPLTNTVATADEALVWPNASVALTVKVRIPSVRVPAEFL